MSDERGGNLLKKKSFRTRVITGAALVVGIVLVFVIGYDLMLIMLGLLSLVGVFEFNLAFDMHFKAPGIIAYVTTAAHFVCLRFVESKYIILVYAIAMICYLAYMVFSFPKYDLKNIFASFFSIFYVGVSLSFLYLLRIHPPSGAYLVWLVVISSWGCDTFAYLFGMLFGKHQLVPKLSPKKSVEGSVGGMLGAIIIAVVYGLIVQRFIPDIEHAPWVFAVLTLIGSFVSQIGDLAASAIKRMAGIKDYGKIFPGHGGVLDRFDSMILVSPVMYIITIYAVMV